MLTGALLSSGALAQAPFPNRTVTMIVGFAPGGGTDIASRIIAKKLSENVGQSVVVENRAGAGGNIATELVARSQPDGYTMPARVGRIALGGAAPRRQAALRPAARSRAGHDGGDVSKRAGRPPVGRRADARGFRQARQGEAGQHQLRLVRHRRSRSPCRRAVPHDGEGRHRPCAVQGRRARRDRSPRRPGRRGVRNAGLCGPAREGREVARARRHRRGSIAVDAGSTDGRRIRLSGLRGDELVRLRRRGKDAEEIVERWNRELVKVLTTPDVREQLLSHGLEPQPGTPEALAKHIERELATWGRVVKEAGITAN
jgi:hypothetical protein